MQLILRYNRHSPNGEAHLHYAERVSYSLAFVRDLEAYDRHSGDNGEDKVVAITYWVDGEAHDAYAQIGSVFIMNAEGRTIDKA